MNMNPMQIINAMQNPNNFMQQIINNSQIMQNPLAKNALEMYQKGDNNGLKQMAENLCREKGIDPNQALKQIKSQFGM